MDAEEVKAKATGIVEYSTRATPAPWTIDDMTDKVCLHIEDKTDVAVAKIFNRADGTMTDNAYLISLLRNFGPGLAQWVLDLTEILNTLRNAFEQDNEHFMAAFIEAIQHGDTSSALRIHELYVHFLDSDCRDRDDLIDERESIRKRLKKA